jgi:hypothetical protein
MSASIVGGEENNTYLLNTRYVNYRLADNGSYIFYHPEAIIITKNLCTILDASFHPIEHFEISNDICLPSFKCKFDGMEDIRIWQDAGSSTIKYMGTSINYSPIQRNRMVTGIYHTTKKRLVKSYVIQPPTDSWCEKNWTPVPSSDPDIPTRIIYKWGPMEVGHLEDGKLVIDATIHIPNPMFQRFRGSTYFRPSVQYPDYLIGLVHFSEHEWPRHYYHVLLLLDKVTLTPVKYSYSISFCKQKSIEFCIGFIENNGYYHFWISQYDRDPAMVSVSLHDLPVSLIV